jgi:hypothetical protein
MKKLMTATNKETWAAILAIRVSKVDKEANPGHVVETRETRVNKAVLVVAANKGSKEARQIVEVSKVRKEDKVKVRKEDKVKVSKENKVKVRKEKFPPIAALLH